MTYKILRIFANTLTVDDKYSLLNRDNLMQPNQMHFSQQQKKVLLISLCIFEIYIKFETFFKKDDPLNLCISKITNSERRA